MILVFCTLASLLFQPAMASLVIAVYSNDQIYLASDSLSVMSGYETNKESHLNSKKIFKVSSNCCASITGAFGAEFVNVSSNQKFGLDLPGALGHACDDACKTTNNLEERINNIIGQFSDNHSQFIRLECYAGKRTNGVEGTRVCFWGYDTAKDRFFGSSYLFDWTNDVVASQAFDSKHIDRYYIGIQGEDNFLPSVIINNGANIKLRSAGFSKTLQDLNSTNSVSDQQMVSLIIEMFQLHKKYACQLSSDKGWIDEPYLIFKITKNSVVELN